MKKLFILCMLAGPAGLVRGQDSTYRRHPGGPYKLKPALDIPLVAGGAALDIYNFGQIGAKNSTSLGTLQDLRISDIPWIDRWAVHPYSHSTDKASYLPFYVAMPAPLIVFGIDSRMRKDFWKLTYMYGEAMVLTGVLYTSAVHWFSRLRPLTYESSSPIAERTSANSRNSFFAGHVALVGTSFFFIAQAYADYHPESHYKWAFYTGAAVVTALTAYLRSQAGEHFPTDVALGAAVGVASGLLTPMLHRVSPVKKLSLLPFGPKGKGVTMLYHF
jgi:membrane-associated phospholipid phosphatase